MSVASIAYYTSLDYTFPIYDRTVEVVPNVPKDVLLSQTLRLPRFNNVEPPMRSNKPITRSYHNNEIYRKDPLADLLYESRQKINNYLLSTTQTKVATPIKVNKREPKNIINDQTARKTTPITNKTIFFSPSGKGKRSSTPISKDLQTLLRRKSSKNLKQKLLKMDQASLVTIPKPIPEPKNYNLDYDESDYDHLACHADNIMRMAVDSTMLGSTFNSSFSSSFSNSFSQDMQGKDFFDKEAKRTILEGLNF